MRPPSTVTVRLHVSGQSRVQTLARSNVVMIGSVTCHAHAYNLHLECAKEPISLNMTRPVGKITVAHAAATALSLDRASPLALHAQLALQLRQMILCARIRPGMRLPSSRSLAEDLSVSRATIVLAYDQLANEGYLEGRQGAGIFVSPSLPEQSLKLAPTAKGVSSSAQHRLEPPLAPTRPFMGAADPLLFPFEHWSRLLYRTWRYPRPELLARPDPFGWPH